jgi:anti-sigma factor RsiW
MDGELGKAETLEVARHVEECAECRARGQAYRALSREIEKYCETILPERNLRRLPLLRALAGAAAVIVLLAMTWVRLQRHAAPTSSVAVARVVAPAPADLAQTPTRGSRAARSTHASELVAAVSAPATHAVTVTGASITDDWDVSEPAIEIAIPAEAIFPPGAVPDGMSFVADVTVGPDGTAHGLRLRPELTGFEEGR